MDRKDLGIALLRITVGGIFAAHGIQKLAEIGIPGLAGMLEQQGFPLPMLSALALVGAELLGGLALVAGLFTRWAAVPLAFTMGVAAFGVHLEGGFFLPDGLEFAFSLMVSSITLILTGAGAFSVDGLLERRRQGKRMTSGEVRRASGIGT